jgi:hypothetical protein
VRLPNTPDSESDLPFKIHHWDTNQHLDTAGLKVNEFGDGLPQEMSSSSSAA